MPVESPASWPLEALKAQAVAARTYAITSTKGGIGFEQYPDTRSQVYGGIGVEQPTTNQAVAETARQVVTYQGRPVTTYFFSTSGGRTENNENSFGGAAAAVAALRRGSLRQRLAAPPLARAADDGRRAGRKLSGLVKGRFRGVKVITPRRLAARRRRRRRRHARHHARDRLDAAGALRPLRHLGLLHVDRHQEEAAGRGDPGRAAAAARGRRGHRRRRPRARG